MKLEQMKSRLIGLEKKIKAIQSVIYNPKIRDDGGVRVSNENKRID